MTTMTRARHVFNMLHQYVEPVINLFGIYILWISAFYFASHLHVKYCVPATVLGFILTPFLVPAPHCQAMRWVIYNGGNSIMSAWFILGAWIITYLRPIQRP